MKVFLMHESRSFDVDIEMTQDRQVLVQDLALDTLLNAMSGGDDFLLKAARAALVSGAVGHLDNIVYRQEVLRDCIAHEIVVRNLYNLTIEVIELEKRGYWWGFSDDRPSGLLMRSKEELKMLVEMLSRVANFAGEYGRIFQSKGFASFFSMLKAELPDERISRIRRTLDKLTLGNSATINAELGGGNKGANYKLLRPRSPLFQWMSWKFQRGPKFTLQISPRDTDKVDALLELKDRGANHLANVLAQAADQIREFFQRLRTELAFYIGCLNLRARLTQMDAHLCLPLALPSADRRHFFTGLYDVSLALQLGRTVVTNDVTMSGKNIIIVTGAAQGGKSTFLRSIGLAQLMMQCGMFVAADSFTAQVCAGLFTHYKREEDVDMKSGKLDEELRRLNFIVDRLKANCVVLLNESFAATNEREGSEIAMHVVSALVERGIRVFYVTHLFEFVSRLHRERREHVEILSPERRTDGTRSFRIDQGEPHDTSYGRDLFEKIFDSTAMTEA